MNAHPIRAKMEERVLISSTRFNADAQPVTVVHPVKPTLMNAVRILASTEVHASIWPMPIYVCVQRDMPEINVRSISMNVCPFRA